MKIAVLEARTKEGILLFAEGCDYDGYSTHQVIVPLNILSDSEKALIGKNGASFPFEYIGHSLSENINLTEQEAKDHCRDYDNFIVSIKYIEYK